MCVGKQAGSVGRKGLGRIGGLGGLLMGLRSTSRERGVAGGVVWREDGVLGISASRAGFAEAFRRRG